MTIHRFLGDWAAKGVSKFDLLLENELARPGATWHVPFKPLYVAQMTQLERAARSVYRIFSLYFDLL